ncbi:flagellar assembly protein FliX [Fodinicurvata halophila]|uniref:Flagellar assembly protein FliX n=1 Tax=Fodinicurvata halophila TaxID=1419723 RepID=A0ABV8UJ98_9PROT
MKIDSFSSTQSTGAKRRTSSGRSGDGSFSRILGDSGQSSSVNQSGPVGTVDSLLSLQEVGGGSDQRQRSHQHAKDVLDQLEELRLELLSGRLSLSLLERIGKLLADRPEDSGDPQLEGILQDIELRAAVELAKLQR